MEIPGRNTCSAENKSSESDERTENNGFNSMKRKAIELENDQNLENFHTTLNKKIAKSIPSYEFDFEDDITIEKLDELINKDTYKLESLESLALDTSQLDEVFKILTEKSGITKDDKNMADVSEISKLLQIETQSLASLQAEKNARVLEFQAREQDLQKKLAGALSDLHKSQSELNTLALFEQNSEKTLSKYSEILENFGISINQNQNLFEVVSNQETTIFEVSGSSKYILKSKTSDFLYNGSQVIYPSEMSSFIYRLLINIKQ